MTAGQTGQAQLFAPVLPQGFVYRDGMITAAQEAELAERFAALPFKPFEFHGYQGNRRIVSYGWHYDYARRALKESEPLPDFLLSLRQQAGALAGLEPERFQQTLVTEYAPGAGIGWHRDKPMFEDVVGFSFLSPCTLRFRCWQGAKWQRLSMPVAPRSAYLLRGLARRQWEHSIPAVKLLRYSVTFRTFVEEGRTFTEKGRTLGGNST